MLHAIALTLLVGAASPAEQLQRATRLAEAIAGNGVMSARV
ncbi:MAG TPA: hypothetical protein VKT72_18130 [Candidatus Baltobacteraceae bacterium]|nr:hypothetical protein [Candidatus Baltobacteraceae bacterium]